MKKFAIVFCAIGMLLPVTQVLAETKIAYVNGARLATEVPQRSQEDEKLKQSFEKRSEELKSKFEAFQQKGEQFRKDKVLLSQEKQAQRLQELREEEVALLKQRQEFEQEFAQSRNEGINRLENLISEVIAEIAQEKDIDIVLQQVVYADEKINITDEVIKRLKERN